MLTFLLKLTSDLSETFFKRENWNVYLPPEIGRNLIHIITRHIALKKSSPDKVVSRYEIIEEILQRQAFISSKFMYNIHS